MSAKETATIGRFSFYMNPYFAWFLAELMRPDVTKGVCKKSAQVGWTQAVILNFLGWLIHIRKGTAIVMFPKEGAAEDFNREKFEPMVEGTPAVAEVLSQKSRSKDLKQRFKNYIGGFLKFVGANSISEVKSTSAQYLIVEEPDDCNLNLRGQGDSIKLLEERGKSYRKALMLIGGTPSIRDTSSIDDEFENSNQCYWQVPCPCCGEYQKLEWERVRWEKDPSAQDPILGQHLVATARYYCVHCDAPWTDVQKNTAIREGKAVPEAPFRGVVGLALNELYSQMHNSRLAALAEKFVKAARKLKLGDASEMIVFFNATLGLSWVYKDGSTEPDQLRHRAQDYPPMLVPRGGLIVSAGVDVQHDRLAIVLRAWGRGEESWLLQFIEIEGNPLDLRPVDQDGVIRQNVWQRLDELLFTPIRHADGFYLQVGAVTIDAGDGTTSDAVYSWVRKQRWRPNVKVMAGKGARTVYAEIFSKPQASVDTDYRNTKASKYGLRVYQVGVSKAKDLLIGTHGRLMLDGSGPARFHFTKHVRPDYCDQLLSERKVPKRGTNGLYTNELVWQRITGRRNEALDCENYALHAARSLKVHTKTEADWSALEGKLRQATLFEMQPEAPEVDDYPEQDDEPGHEEVIEAVDMMDAYDD